MEGDFCEYCDAQLEQMEKPITVYRHRKGQHFIFEQVPARVCPRCGERYLSAAVVQEMDRLMRTPGEQRRMVSVPVIAFQAAG